MPAICIIAYLPVVLVILDNVIIRELKNHDDDFVDDDRK